MSFEITKFEDPCSNRLCSLQQIRLLRVLASTLILGSEPHEAHNHILLPDDSGSLQTTLSADMYVYTVNLNGREGNNSLKGCLPVYFINIGL
jgi:hypothetical protein